MELALVRHKKSLHDITFSETYMTLGGRRVDYIIANENLFSMDVIRAAVLVETKWNELGNNWNAVYDFYKAHPLQLPIGVQLKD